MREHPGKGTREEVAWPQGTGQGALESQVQLGFACHGGWGPGGGQGAQSMGEVGEDTLPPLTEFLRLFPTDRLFLHIVPTGDVPGGPVVNSLRCTWAGWTHLRSHAPRTACGQKLKKLNEPANHNAGQTPLSMWLFSLELLSGVRKPSHGIPELEHIL